jgi:hypothetical protein
MNPDSPLTLKREVPSDDVEITVFYLDVEDVVSQVSRSFIGQPCAKEIYDMGDHRKIDTFEYRGSRKFTSWLADSFKLGCYEVGSLIIPTHRLLKITQVVTERKEKVEVQKYQSV